MRAGRTPVDCLPRLCGGCTWLRGVLGVLLGPRCTIRGTGNRDMRPLRRPHACRLCFRNIPANPGGRPHSGSLCLVRRLTIHSSRTRFAGRLNSGVRHGRSSRQLDQAFRKTVSLLLGAWSSASLGCRRICSLRLAVWADTSLVLVVLAPHHFHGSHRLLCTHALSSLARLNIPICSWHDRVLCDPPDCLPCFKGPMSHA